MAAIQPATIQPISSASAVLFSSINLQDVSVEELMFLVFTKSAQAKETGIRVLADKINKNNAVLEALNKALAIANANANGSGADPSKVMVTYTDPATGKEVTESFTDFCTKFGVAMPIKSNEAQAEKSTWDKVKGWAVEIGAKSSAVSNYSSPQNAANWTKDDWKLVSQNISTKVDSFSSSNQMDLLSFNKNGTGYTQDIDAISNFLQKWWQSKSGIIANFSR
jgi:hypothetical protein